MPSSRFSCHCFFSWSHRSMKITWKMKWMEIDNWTDFMSVWWLRNDVILFFWQIQFIWYFAADKNVICIFVLQMKSVMRGETLQDFGPLWRNEIWWDARTQLFLPASIDNLAFCINMNFLFLRRTKCSRDGHSLVVILSKDICVFHALISSVHREYFSDLLIGIQPKCQLSFHKISQNKWARREICFVSLCHRFVASSHRADGMFDEKRWQTENLVIFQVLNFTKCDRNKNEKRDRATFMCRIPFVRNARFDMIDYCFSVFFPPFSSLKATSIWHSTARFIADENISDFFQKIIFYITSHSASINQTVSYRLHQLPLLQPMPKICLLALASITKIFI